MMPDIIRKSGIALKALSNMEEYEITLELKVRIEAPSESDAYDVVADTFGTGSACGVDVLEYEVVRHVGPK